MDAAQLPSLRACLVATTWRHLLAMMESHGLPCSTRWRKDDLVAALHAHLSDPAVLRRVVLALPASAQAALLALLNAAGALPVSQFSTHFGQVRPHRPWREEAGQPPPWRSPASPAERLWYLGLFYLMPHRPPPGERQRAVVPAELLGELAALLLIPQFETPVRLCAQPGSSPDLLWDLALLLATLTENPARLLHKRWLPPGILAKLATRMGLTEQPGRSERKSPYLAFVHYLALAADLLAGESCLGLTAAAWSWLAAETPARWEQLWRSWLDAPADLATAFQLPWGPLGPATRQLVLAEVARLPLDRFVPLAQVVEQAHLHDHWDQLAQPWGEAEDVAATLITHPLWWLGVVMLGERSSDHPAAWPAPVAAATGEEDGVGPPTVPDLLVRLTPMGAWLLGVQGWGPPPFAAPERCTIRQPHYNQVLVPPTARPVHLARLAPFCQWLPPEPPAPAQRLWLTEERVAAAVAGGMALPQVAYYLEEALSRPLSRRQRRRLHKWARAGQRVRIQRLTVLETDDARLMGKLRSRKLIRRHLGATLSPTRVVVNPAALPALGRTLQTLNLYAALPVDTEAGVERVSLSPADASLLLLAGLVYKGLGAHIPLPAALSGDLVAELASHLPAAHREAAEVLARQVLEAVAGSLQGYLLLPTWQEDRVDPRTILPIIERALANGKDLQLTYWAAGREQVLERWVTPYWLEQRGNTSYLIAYCHLREAERVFRVDRIVTCRPAGDVGD